MDNKNYADGLGAIDYQRIKLLNPLVAYCENHGIALKRSSNRWKGKCPLHNEQNGEAFVIHPDQKWQCYGSCARQGDVIDLEMLLHGGTIAEAGVRLLSNTRVDSSRINTARRLDGGTPTGVPVSVSITPIGGIEIPKLVPTQGNPLALPYVLSDREIQDCHRFTVRLLEDQTYMERICRHRQWKLETIRDLGLDGYLGMDDDGHFCFNSAAGCKSRWREPRKLTSEFGKAEHWRQDGERRFKFLFGKSSLWRAELIPAAETIYLCEGETDAITLIDTGLEADGKTAIVALQGATFNIEPWSFLFANKDVIIATDYDEAGRKAAQNIKRAISGSARTIKYLRLDKEGKQNV
jgi:5S rRNA maturation endonuclease (ribonuclease M5)